MREKNKEKPILFNGAMVNAILVGQKTVTRRVMKPANRVKARWEDYHQGHGLWVDKNVRNGDRCAHVKDYSVSAMWWTEASYIKRYAPYKLGDVLYVRETVCGHQLSDGSIYYRYRATDPDGNKCPMNPEHSECWTPAIHMPKEAARIRLDVTGVRIERLQDMTDEEAFKEGIRTDMLLCSMDDRNYAEAIGGRNEFRKLWDSAVSINRIEKRRYAWEKNPWVWVFEFRRI